MLLRSISRHVKDQNWTAIAIDFVIVVIGVYVGIEVSNWNERRTEAQRAQEYLERIEADLAFNIEALQSRQVFWRDVREQGRLALGYLEEGALVEGSAWATLRALFHASQVWRFSFNDTTYTEMLNSGDLSLLDSPSLRTALAEYFVIRAPSRRGDGFYLLLPAYRETVRAAFPSELSSYYWEACHWQQEEAQDITPCDSPIDETEARIVLDEIATTPNLVFELRFWVTSLDVFMNLVEIDLRLTEGLLVQTAQAKN